MSIRWSSAEEWSRGLGRAGFWQNTKSAVATNNKPYVTIMVDDSGGAPLSDEALFDAFRARFNHLFGATKGKIEWRVIPSFDRVQDKIRGGTYRTLIGRAMIVD